MYYSKVQRQKFPAAMKLFRLFKLYSVAIKSFIDAQKTGGLDNVYLVLGNKAKYVTLRIPLPFIIGDNQGGDNICGRTCFYGITAKRISRCCDATPENYSDVSKDSCLFLLMEDIIQLVNDECWDDLALLYQAQFWNPFFEVDYGANTSGIFLAACPPKGLHALEQGVFKHLLEEVLGVYLKPEQITRLDREVQSWVFSCRQRLFRSANFAEAPRLQFKDGISSLSNTAGHDCAGMLFALAIASHTGDGHAAFSRLDANVTWKISYAIEMLLCYWAWLKKDQYWQVDSSDQFETVKTAVSTMLHKLVSCIPWLHGNGWNIPKIHEQLHVAYYIHMVGAHSNLHTGPTEHNHIKLSKDTARRTQMQANEFDIQVANWLVDKLVVELADFNMCSDSSPSPPKITVSNEIPHNSARFNMQVWFDTNQGLHVDLQHPSSHGKYLPSTPVLNCLADFCLQRMADLNLVSGITNLCGVTKIRVNTIHMRANPAEEGGAWYNNIGLGEEENENGMAFTICAKLQFIFYFPEAPHNYFAVIHPAYGYQPM